MAIYTRTGDAGTTSLFSGQRVSKTHPRVEAYGTLDELNAALSLCVCAVQSGALEALSRRRATATVLVQCGAGERKRNTHAVAALHQHGGDRRAGTGHRPGRWRRWMQCTVLFFPVAANPPRGCIWPVRLPAAPSAAHWWNWPDRSTSVRCCCVTSTVFPTVYTRWRGWRITSPTSNRLLPRWRPVTAPPPARRRSRRTCLSFHELHQLVRAAMTRASALSVPVVISVVDAHGIGMLTGACRKRCW